LELYAKFHEHKKQYTVRFLNADGTTYAETKVEYGGKLVMPATPDKAHYEGEWAYQGEGKAPLVMPLSDIEFKVAYTPKAYTVTFYRYARGNAILKTETYTIEDKTIALPEVPEKEGFDGVWSAYALNGGDIEVRPIYTAKKTQTTSTATEKDGCGSVAFATPVFATLTACIGLAVLKRKEN
jgi:hypothetical protein